MPLREILQNFLDHVKEFDHKYQNREDLYEAEFQNLKVLTEELRALPQYSCSQGEQDVNRRKNRYKDILPYDGNRVILGEVSSSPGSTYINASFIKGASGSTAYIASQAPLPHTVDDFWRMIWEWEVQVVVMASNEIEGGRQKCVRYWPTDDEVLQFGEVTVSLVGQRAMGTDYTVKELSAKSGDVTRTIHHFHYQTWPDHGVPLAVQPIIEMVGFVRKFQVSETLPVLVHCSAGCGRTGTVCAIDFVWGLLRAGKLHKDFSLKQLIFDMRKQRIAMVQTKEQYVLVHRAVKELFEEHLKVIDNHPYENIDFSGRPLILNEDPDHESVIIDPANKESKTTGASGESGTASSGDGRTSEKQRTRFETDSTSDVAKSSQTATDGAVATLPPLPTKTRVGRLPIQQPGGGDCAAEESDAAARSSGESRAGESPPTDSTPRNEDDDDEDKSRMDYVSNWCNGIASGSGKDDDETAGSQSDLGGSRTESALATETRQMSSSRVTLASEDSGPPVSSARPSSSSPSPSGTQQQPPSRTRKNRFQKRSTTAEPDDRIKVSKLVRKPSIAKLKALFETDSSGPPSPDLGHERDTSPLKSIRPGSTTGSTTTDLSSSALSDANVVSAVASGDVASEDVRRRKRGKKLYVERSEYEAANDRYVDTALRIFEQHRRATTNLADSKLSESYRLLNASPGPPSESSVAEAPGGGGTLVSSTVSLSSTSSPHDERRRSNSSSHSPSPSVPDTGAGTGMAQQAKDLVGRFRRVRRNSSSAEKRQSTTWYDGEVQAAATAAETPAAAATAPELEKQFVPTSPALSGAGTRKQSRVAQLLFGGGSLEKKGKKDKMGVPVKRSISMKVNFRSPLLRRKSVSGGAANENVAAYLAVEEGKRRPKILVPRQHPHQHHRLSGGTGSQPLPVVDGDTVVLVGAKNYVRRMQGYVNARPLAPSVLGGDAVQLTNFRLKDEVDNSRLVAVAIEEHRRSPSPARRILDPALQQQYQQPRRRPEKMDERTLGAVTRDSVGTSPYSSPALRRKSRDSGDGSRSPSLLRGATHVLVEENPRSRSNSPRTLFLVSEPARMEPPRRRQCMDVPYRDGQLPTDGISEFSCESPRQDRRSRSPLPPISSGRSDRVNTDRDESRQSLPSKRTSSPVVVEGRGGRSCPPPSRPDGSGHAVTPRHNFFGSEMDDYCQQILRDCQDYLVHHNHPEYCNLTPEARRNIRMIEDTVQRSPRRGIVDVTSSSENPSNCVTSDGGAPLAGSSDYERIWFSRSGGRPAIPLDDDDSDGAAATSVEEVSMAFLAPEEDEDDGTSAEDDQHGGRVQQVAFDNKKQRESNDHDSRANEFLQRTACGSGGGKSRDPNQSLPKDVRFCRTVEELKSLIEELHVHDSSVAAAPRRQRKPQPAPRTILDTRVAGRPPLVAERIYANCGSVVDGGAAVASVSQLREAVRFEHATPLREGSPHSLDLTRPLDYSAVSNASGSNHHHNNNNDNHDYEEIRFHGEKHRRAAAHNRVNERGPLRSPLESQYGRLTRIRTDYPDGVTLDARARDEIAATRVYGQVHKPRRRKQSPPDLAASGLLDGVVGSSESRPNDDHHYEVLRCPPGWREELGGVSGSIPVAPPRIRRQPSTSSNHFRPDDCRPDAQVVKTDARDQEYSKEPWLGPRNKWEAEFDEDHDDEEDDDSPPVPVKTKDAYRLPKGATSNSTTVASAANSSAINTSFDNVSSGSSSQASSSGLSITKALTKLHTNFFSKLTSKNDKTEYDSSSIGSGSTTPPSSHKKPSKDPSTNIEFPHRLESKPKGPRDPPAHWKVSAK